MRPLCRIQDRSIDMRRSHFLKYASILMMLTSLVRVVFGFMMINFYATALNMGGVDKQLMTVAGIAFGLLLACAAAELISGFIGALNWEEPLRAGRCVLWGAVTLFLGLAGNLVQGLTGYGISIVAWTTGAVVPLVFLTAAVLFHRGSKKA